MLNIDGKILDKLEADEYYLFSILLNYGTKSHPCNDVLKKKTGWGANRVQKAKTGLISKNLVVSSPRFKMVDGKSYRDSNEYTISTKLASKFNGKKAQPPQSELLQFEVVEIEVHENEVLQFEVVQSEVLQNEVGNKVLKLLIIETSKLLKEKVSIEEEPTHEEPEYNPSEQIKKSLLEAERKEKVYKPIDHSNWTQLDVNLSSYKLPSEWSEKLTKEVVEYWRYMEVKKGVNWGTVRTISMQVDSLKNFLLKFSESEIIDSLHECQERGNVSYNPEWTTNRKAKEKSNNSNNESDDGTPSYMMGMG